MAVRFRGAEFERTGDGREEIGGAKEEGFGALCEECGRGLCLQEGGRELWERGRGEFGHGLGWEGCCCRWKGRL